MFPDRPATSTCAVTWACIAFTCSAVADSPPVTRDMAAPPRRIVATAPSNAEIICALGAGDRLVGISPYVTYPPRIRELPKVGGLHDPDLEAILALRPDLLVLRGHSVKVTRLCAAHGIAVYHDRTDTLGTLHATIRDMGRLLQQETKASELSRQIRSRLEEIRASGARAHRPRVLLTVRSPTRLVPLTTVGRGSYLDEIIDLAGGVNIFGDCDLPYPQVTLEEILARRPEVIVEALPGEHIDHKTRGQLLAQWHAVGLRDVVGPQRIHFLTEDYLLIPSPRVTLLAERLAGIFRDRAVVAPRTGPVEMSRAGER
jgi:iron complex transport system substrate-binding protein